MEKILVRRPGNFDRLEHVSEAGKDPEPGPGELAIAVESCGVNFADCVVRMGLYPSAKEYVGWPITPGFELAGRVVARGQGAEQFELGQRVFGVSLFGAYASHVVVPEDQLFAVPEHLSIDRAGAFPVVGLTAYYALIELGAAREGKRVLVHSATGGVGSTLVQLAKILGCWVTAVVGSSRKRQTAESLGADAVLVKEEGDWEAGARSACPEGYDIILDANGVETLAASYRLLRPTGRLVIYGAHTMLSRGSGRRNWFKLGWTLLRTPKFNPLRLTNENRNIMAFNLSYLFSEKEQLRASMGKLMAWEAAGKLQAPEIQSFPLKDAAAAHRALQSGTTVGKLILKPRVVQQLTT